MLQLSKKRALSKLTYANAVGLLIFWAAETYIGERHWLTTALLYFPQQWIAVPGACLWVSAVIKRDKRLAALNLLCLLFIAWYFAGFNVPFNFGRESGDRPLRVMTYNIHYGSGGAEKLAEVIRQQKPDVLCIQESRAFGVWPDPVPHLQKLLPGWHMERGAEVATFSRLPIVAHRVHPMAQPLGRVVLETTVAAGGRPVTVLNTHISTAGNKNLDSGRGLLVGGLCPAISKARPKHEPASYRCCCVWRTRPPSRLSFAAILTTHHVECFTGD